MIFSSLRTRWRAFWRVERTPGEVADIVEAFVQGRGGDWDWDDLVSAPIRDPELQRIVRECAGVHEAFPPKHPGQYTNDEGLEFLGKMIQELRRREEARTAAGKAK